MSGYGSTPFGTGPYGFGTPITVAGNNGVVLTDANGLPQAARYINPATRRYEYDANGRAVGMPASQQLVLLAMLTIRGTSADRELGDAAPSGVIGANYVQAQTAAIELALQRLVDAKTIEIVEITIDTSVRPIFRLVRWRDLTTMIEQELQV